MSDAELDRKPERRRFDRRSGNDRRIASMRRRRSDRNEIFPIDDVEALRVRMLGKAGEASRMRHAVEPFDPAPEAVAVDERRSFWAHWWDLVRGRK